EKLHRAVSAIKSGRAASARGSRERGWGPASTEEVVASDTGRKRELLAVQDECRPSRGEPQAWCRAPADVRARRAQRSGSRAQRWFRVDFVLRDPWRRNQRPWYSRDRPSLAPSDSRREDGRARELRAASRRANDDG